MKLESVTYWAEGATRTASRSSRDSRFILAFWRTSGRGPEKRAPLNHPWRPSCSWDSVFRKRCSAVGSPERPLQVLARRPTWPVPDWPLAASYRLRFLVPPSAHCPIVHHPRPSDPGSSSACQIGVPRSVCLISKRSAFSEISRLSSDVIPDSGRQSHFCGASAPSTIALPISLIPATIFLLHIFDLADNAVRESRGLFLPRLEPLQNILNPTVSSWAAPSLLGA
jgi:hypothetical protein